MANINVDFMENIAIEMLCCIRRYASNKNIQDNFKEFSIKPDESINPWIEKIKDSISLFLDSELKSLFGVNPFNSSTLIAININNDLNSCEDFIDILEKLSPEEYIKVLHDEFQLKNDITIEELKNAIPSKCSDDDINLIFEMLNNPQETLERMRYAIKKFYSSFFSCYVNELESLLQKKLAEHKVLYKEYGISFIKLTTFLDEATIDNINYITFYISYFKDTNTMMLKESKDYDSLYVVYGFQLEKYFDNTVIAERRKLLFKALSDEKRIEIIQLLSKRSWYGIELAKHLGITTATLSYHVAKLFEIGIISYEEKEKNRFYYKLEVENLKELFETSLKNLIE